ncbi:MAG: hypothetical protein LR011_08300, partial [Verrucomicrobia bacterium]|nr:hypothetical protein [Verrucomicrobiota bacterium]
MKLRNMNGNSVIGMKKCLRVWYGMMGLMLVAMEIQACRYSIRDVSFVDLEPVPYQFFWMGGEAGARDEDMRRQLSAAATALLSDANLQFSGQLPPESVREKWQGKPLILVAPDGRSLGMEMESGTSDLDGWAMKTVRSLISSDLRRSILDAAIENYALVILVDGLDETENQRAAEAARNALDEVGKLLPRMPKPVD